MTTGVISEDMATTGERIQEARKSIGMSQAELSRRLGISPGAMWKYEKGNVNMGPERLAATAAELRVSMEWLLSGAEPDDANEVDESPPGYHEFVERFGELFDAKIVEALAGPAANRFGPKGGPPTAKEYLRLAQFWEDRS